ncbi:MAG: methionyl-tRNA formyltransferase [Candidatus Binatia bacterium]
MRTGVSGGYKSPFMSLRIALVGQAAFGEKTLERLVAAHHVAAVYCPPDGAGGKVDPLKRLALDLGIPVHQPKSMKGDDVLREFTELGADLAVLAFVTVIVPERLLSVPKLGTICFHPSLLPRYRGGSAINWQLIRGERRGGLTIFWTDAGIDTGPILLQKEVAIGPDDTVGSLYYEQIFPLGLDAMEEAVRLIAEGRAPRVPQDESQASYDPLCREQHVGIDWSRPGREVYDLVRGSDPQPGAWGRHHGERLRVYDCRYLPDGGGEAGQILLIGPEGAEISLVDGVLLVGRMRLGDATQKTTPEALARDDRIRVGDRLEAGEAHAR